MPANGRWDLIRRLKVKETRKSAEKEVGEERRRARTCERGERKASEDKHTVAAGWRKGRKDCLRILTSLSH